MSQPFTELNSWGGSNVSFTCTEVVDATEGDIIVCPIPTFNRAHDLGPLNNNGLRITHDLSSLVGNVQLGNISVVLANTVSSPNVSIQNLGNMVYRIGNIRTPEDYLAATGIIDLPTDVGNVTFQFTSTVLNQNSNVTFIVNTTVNVDDQVEWIIPNPPYPTGNLEQSLWPLVYGANTTTQFDDTLQTAYVADLENPDAGPYTVTIDTQDYPGRFFLSSTANAAFGNMWYRPGTDQGRLTLTGSRTNINTYLGNLQVSTDSGFVAGAHPTQRTITRVLRTTPAPSFIETFTNSGGNVVTNQSPYASGGSAFYFDMNATQANLGTGSATASCGFIVGRSLPIVNGTQMVTPDATWDLVTNALTGSSFTHEFWIRADSIYRTMIFTGRGMSIGLYDGNIWALIGGDLPNMAGAVTPPTSFPRRIENNTTISDNTWYHIALVRNAGEITLYVNGGGTNTYYSTGTTTTNRAATVDWAMNTAGSLTAGFVYGGSGTALSTNGSTRWRNASFKGYLTDVRISSTARYTSTFSPPTTPFFNDAPTFVLLNFRNGIVDDYVLPDLGTTIRTMTWTLTNPSGLVSPLTQPYTQERTGFVQFGNVSQSRFGNLQIVHVDSVAQGTVPYIEGVAPYNIGGYSDDFIDVEAPNASNVTISDHDTGNNATVLDLVRYAPRDGRLSLPAVGAIVNTVNSQFPGLYDDFDTAPYVIQTNDDTDLFFDVTTQTIVEYQYDTILVDTVSAVTTTISETNACRQTQTFTWNWQHIGSEFGSINGITMQMLSIQLENNVGGWTLAGGYYGDWSGVVGASFFPAANLLAFRLRFIGPNGPVAELGDYVYFGPNSTNPTPGAPRAFSWVSAVNNNGLYAPANTPKTFTVGVDSRLASNLNSIGCPFIPNKTGQIVVSVSQPTLSANTIPVPGGGFTSPGSYTKTIPFLYG